MVNSRNIYKDYPSNWIQCSFTKYLASIVDYRGKTPEKVPDGVFLVTARNIKNGKIDYSLSQEYVREEDYEEIMHRGKLHIGDVLFTTEAPMGEVANADRTDFALAQRVIKFSGIPGKLNNYYLKYWILNPMFQSQLQSLGTGSTAQGIKAAKLGMLRILIPSWNEQLNIVKYLDAKCSEIDALTADIQTQIDTLEQYKRSVITEAVTKGLDKQAHVKDSGVFYMAPMNENWYLTKIGYICSKLARSFEPEDTALICSNKGKVLIRPEDASGIMVSEDNAMQGIHKGDIAIHGMDTWHGAIALSDYDGKITRVVHVCDSTEDKRFIVYYLQYLAFQGVYKLISNGVRGNTSDFRSWDKVRDIWIAIPKSKSEQKEICDYLDDMCAEIEGTVAIKNDQLSTLYAYKKSIIYEYVTGKKEVPSV